MTHQWSNIVNVIGWGFVSLVLGYMALRAYAHSDDRRGLVVRWIISAVLIFIALFILSLPTPMKYLLFILPLVVLAFIWIPSFGSMITNPLTDAFDGGSDASESKAFYFIAEGKRRKGLYAEAITEVRKQLEQFPGDFEGYMKLASIQMENLKDLPAAQATLNEFLELPDCAPNQIVSALHLLADWQLQYGRDAQAATVTLQRIVQLYPGTSFDHMAKQRIAHLGSADETSRVRHETKFTVPSGRRDLGLGTANAPVDAPADPHAQAAELVKQLELHPSDTEAREKLAVLYAEEFQRLDLAVDQLEQLIALPAEPPKRVARWLNLLATLHIKYAYNMEAGERALRRITERFPGGALADVAVQRLASLQMELKASQRTPGKRLGIYEKNVGLKQSNG